MADDDMPARWAAIARVTEARGDVDRAVAELYRLPADVPGRGRLAAGLIGAVLRTGTFAGVEQIRDLERLLAIADTEPPATPQWPGVRARVRALSLMRAATEQDLTDPRAALAELDKLEAEAGDGPGGALIFTLVRQAMEFLRATREGDEAAIRNLVSDVEGLRKLAVDVPGADALVDTLSAGASMMAAHRSDTDRWGQLDNLRETVGRLPQDHPVRSALADAMTVLQPMRGILDDGPDSRPDDGALAGIEAMARNAALGVVDRANAWAMLGGGLLDAGRETDRARVDRGIDAMREAVALRVPDGLVRAVHLQGLALGLFRRSELTAATADLDEAAGILEQARAAAGGPGHPQWSAINDMLAHVRRRRGESAGNRQGESAGDQRGESAGDQRGESAGDRRAVALEGLRGYVWQVLVQSDLEAATMAARGAAAQAVETAQWFLSENDPVGAIAALDAGRGLTLYAATAVRGVADRLHDAGHDDLANRWRAVAGDPAKVSGALRHEVLTVLSAHGSAGELLDAPDLGEIRDALATLDADVLVYLVPGSGQWPGFAVTAPRTGSPGFISLPNLESGRYPAIDAYLDALANRGTERDLAAQSGGQELTDRLSELCDWAWRAAIGPLLEHYLPSVRRADPDRPPRIVLIPMGQLSRVPWQAARNAKGDYAVQLAAFSTAASARMLCRSAAASPVPGTPVGLIVGDPETGPGSDVPDLLSARLEAFAVHQAFYRGGRYVGRRPNGTPSPSGAGTRDEVTAWLTSAGDGAGGMLHLACHGEANATARTSYLLLAGGATLNAEELVNLLDAGRQRAIGLVVLAACRTGQAINGYDEAYSLGTAFLAGGVRSVLATQWRIPDRDTSVLMYMFHHYLSCAGVPVRDALRRAQLWMLDPDREVPPQMPARLQAELAHTEPAAVLSWAGFSHSGQ